MAVNDVRKILENIPVQKVAEEIEKLSIPRGVYVRVIIETVESPSGKRGEQPDEIDAGFLKEMEGLPTADDLPEDLAHQHDHYLYGLPKKS